MESSKKEFVFFSMNNFEKEGGDTIRMYGVLNAIANHGNEVTLISNAKDYSKFNKNVKHLLIDVEFTKSQKRFFQIQLTLFPIKIVNYKFSLLFKKLISVFESINAEKVFFFEYLDNSIGYWLFKNDVIPSYINDTHGIATAEFDFQRKIKNKISDKILLSLKYHVAKKLDKKVLLNSRLNIFLSNSMREYFINLYPALEKERYNILPNLLSHDFKHKKVDIDCIEKLRFKFNLKGIDKVIMFVGSFKLTGGVLDLIKAFEKVKVNSRIKLLLIGDGFEKRNCELYVEKNNLKDRVTFVDRISYENLPTYQQLADVLVCPDKQNVFSNVILHTKYLDCLLANKVVINGSFDSVKEVNIKEKLSLNFIPSDIDDLCRVLTGAINNYELYKKKYNKTRDYVCENLTFRSNIDVIINSK